MAALSWVSSTAGLAPVRRTSRALALGSHAVSWALKSSGEAKDHPGRKEVSRNWFARSTTPLLSGSYG
jgi:hypothetical protein